MSAAASNNSIQGGSIIESLVRAEVRTVVALPDIVTCETVLWPIVEDSRFRLVMVCKEDEGVSICAALSYCEIRAVLLIQHTGFLDSINSIRAIAVEYQLPVVMLVGLQGLEPGFSMQQSRSVGIRALASICNGLELKYIEISSEEDAAQVAPAIQTAYVRSQPIVLFLTVAPL